MTGFGSPAGVALIQISQPPRKPLTRIPRDVYSRADDSFALSGSAWLGVSGFVSLGRSALVIKASLSDKLNGNGDHGDSACSGRPGGPGGGAIAGRSRGGGPSIGMRSAGMANPPGGTLSSGIAGVAAVNRSRGPRSGGGASRAAAVVGES